MSTTNGWDAVCALELSEVNDLLLQEHLNNSPGSPGLPLAFGTSASRGRWLASVVLSPPELSFGGGDAQQATLTASVQSAALVGTDGSLAFWLPLGAAPLTRTTHLQSLSGGIDSLGQVVATFGGTDTPPYGVTPMDAVESGIASTPMSYVLGTILNDNSGPGLQPSSFDFALQNAATGSALLLLIATSGTPGSPGPLPHYPLPAGSTAALIISEQTMFTKILPAALEETFNNSLVAGLPPITPLQLTVQQDGVGSWVMEATAGVADFATLMAVIPPPADPPDPFQGGEPFAMTTVTPGVGPDCAVPFTGEGTQFTVVFAAGTLQINWTAAWYQVWKFGLFPNLNFPPANLVGRMLFTYSCVSTPAIDPDTEVVTLTGTETSSLGIDPTGPGAAQLLPYFQPPALLYLSPADTQVFVASLFPTVPVASINTFALDNLLFPEQNDLSLTSVAFPSDLVLSGSLVSMITVMPATATVASGGTVQFSASADVLWRCAGGGHITGSGLFTAPTVNAAHSVTITAFTGTGATTHAQVTALPSLLTSGITVTPSFVLLSPSVGVEITITGAGGEPQPATCTLNEGDAGTLTPLDAAADAWLYTAPESSGGSVTVTATSIADPSQSGTLLVVVTRPDVITLTWGDGLPGSQSRSLSPGETIEISAAAASQYTNLSWAIFPGAGGGSLVPVDGDPTRVTLTAPRIPQVSPQLPYSICAYYADQSVPAFGAGSAFITLD